MRSREVLLLGDMIDAAERARTLVADSDIESISADRTWQDALLWNFTVLGEAASQLSDPFKAKHPEVDWSRPQGLRNRIVHGYWSIDLDVLVATASDDLPGFVDQLRAVLDQLKDDEGTTEAESPGASAS